jgi:hypothetical protein
MILEQETKVGACWECGYSLRGLETPRCPECGRAFDPADAMTMNMGISVGPVKRFMMRPPGWPLYLLTAVAAVWSFWAAASPTPPRAFVDVLGHLGNPRGAAWDLSMPEVRFLWGAMLWCIVLSAWALRRVARAITVSRLSKQKAAAFAYWRRWLWPPVVFGLTVLVCLTSFPVLGGFWLSRAALNAAVTDGGPKHPSSEWIGIHPLSWDQKSMLHSYEGQKWIFLWDYSNNDPGGFVYCEAGVEPDELLAIPSYYRRMIRFKRLSNNWYSFRTVGPYEK